MTEVIERTDIDLTVLFDFEFEVPCDLPVHDDAAKWKSILRCCGTPTLFCDVCRNNILAVWNTMAGECSICHREHDSLKEFYGNIERLS